jgi:hypothetical protein
MDTLFDRFVFAFFGAIGVLALALVLFILAAMLAQPGGWVPALCGVVVAVVLASLLWLGGR